MIAERLKLLRKQKHISQVDLARALGVASGTVGMWETNRRDPDISTLRKIADYFGVGVNELIEEKAAETTEKPVIKPPAPSGMSENEKTILTVFRELTDTQQGELIGRAKMMAEQNAAENAVYTADENVS